MNQSLHTIYQASLVAWVLLEGWIILRDRWRPITQVNRAGQGGITIVLVITFIIASRVDKLGLFPIPGRPVIPLMIGDCLLWSGLALRLWSVLTLGKFFRASLVVQEDHHVVRDGPYKLLRHPSYSGILLACLGLGVAMGDWLGLGLILAFAVAAISYRIVVEERLLVQTLGQEYLQYAKHTKRLIPFIY